MTGLELEVLVLWMILPPVPTKEIIIAVVNGTLTTGTRQICHIESLNWPI